MNNTKVYCEPLPNLPLDVIGVIFSFLEAEPSYFLVSRDFYEKACEELWFPVKILTIEDSQRLLERRSPRISTLTIRQHYEVSTSVHDMLVHRGKRPLYVSELVFERYGAEKHSRVFPRGVQETIEDEILCMEIVEMLQPSRKVAMERYLDLRAGTDEYAIFAANRVAPKEVCIHIRSGTCIPPVIVDPLFEAFQTNTTVKKLTIKSSIGLKDGPNTKETITSFLELNTSLQSLQISLPGLGEDGIVSAFEWLPLNTSLTSLTFNNSVSHINMGNTDHILRGMRNNTTIQHLGLEEDWITNGQVDSLVETLKTNTTLSSLSLRDNPLNPKEYGKILQTIENSTQIRFLDLSNTPRNTLMQRGSSGEAWKRFLQTNESVTELRVSLDGHPYKAGPFLRSIVEGMGSNKSLQTLHIPNEILVDIDPGYIVRVLRAMTSLRHLHLGTITIGNMNSYTGYGRRKEMLKALEKISERCASLPIPIEVHYNLFGTS